MLQKLIDKGFGIAVWTASNSLYVRIRYKHKERRLEFKLGSRVDECILLTAIRLANDFPELVNIDDMK